MEPAQLTTYQTIKLDAILAAMAEKSKELSKLLEGVYGTCDPRTVRSQELAASVIRLRCAIANGNAPLPAIV